MVKRSVLELSLDGAGYSSLQRWVFCEATKDRGCVFVRADGLSRGRYVCLKEVRLEAAPFLTSSWQVLHRNVAVAGNEVIAWRLMRSASR